MGQLKVQLKGTQGWGATLQAEGHPLLNLASLQHCHTAVCTTKWEHKRLHCEPHCGTVNRTVAVSRPAKVPHLASLVQRSACRPAG